MQAVFGLLLLTLCALVGCNPISNADQLDDAQDDVEFGSWDDGILSERLVEDGIAALQAGDVAWSEQKSGARARPFYAFTLPQLLTNADSTYPDRHLIFRPDPEGKKEAWVYRLDRDFLRFRIISPAAHISFHHSQRGAMSGAVIQDFAAQRSELFGYWESEKSAADLLKAATFDFLLGERHRVYKTYSNWRLVTRNVSQPDGVNELVERIVLFDNESFDVLEESRASKTIKNQPEILRSYFVDVALRKAEAESIFTPASLQEPYASDVLHALNRLKRVQALKGETTLAEAGESTSSCHIACGKKETRKVFDDNIAAEVKADEAWLKSWLSQYDPNMSKNERQQRICMLRIKARFILEHGFYKINPEAAALRIRKYCLSLSSNWVVDGQTDRAPTKSDRISKSRVISYGNQAVEQRGSV